MQWNTRYADGFLDQLVLHHIEADKYFQLSLKGWKSVRDEIDQLEEKVVADGLNNEGWICAA
jgi:hypothetical protein